MRRVALTGLDFRRAGLWHGVITTAPPRMTAENPTNAIPSTYERAVSLDGLEEIVGAGGCVAAASGWACGEFQHRAEDALVKTNQESNDGDGGTGDHDF